MPIATRCTHCGKAYQVAESTLGKQVKCQACGKAFVVAAPKVAATAAGKAAPRANTSTGSANHADSVERARIAKLEAEFGLQPIPPNPNQVFPSTEYQRPRGTPSPLANHVVEDPGFEEISETDFEAYRRAEKAAREAAALQYGKGEDDLVTKSDNDMYWLYIVAMIQVLGGLIGAPLVGIHPMLGIVFFFIPFFVAMFAPMIDIFLVMNRARRLNETLYLFIPFYNIIFYFSNFKIFKNHFLGTIAINFAYVVSFFVFFGVLELLGIDANLVSRGVVKE